MRSWKKKKKAAGDLVRLDATRGGKMRGGNSWRVGRDAHTRSAQRTSPHLSELSGKPIRSGYGWWPRGGDSVGTPTKHPTEYATENMRQPRRDSLINLRTA
jgi:hypothetical protein